MENVSTTLVEAVTTAVPVSIDIPSATSSLAAALSSASTAVAASASATMLSSAISSEGGEGECRLLGPFALFVQLALGGLALLSLVYKRWKERPQRPLKIWFFDVSKQVFGSVLVHVANVFMSMLTSGRFSIKLDPASVQTAQRFMRRDDDQYVPNPCSFYLLNLAIDTTLGIPILLVLLRIFTGLVAYTPLGKPAESIKSGHYGNPPNAWWWLKQSWIYFCGLFGMKICVLILFLMMPWISRIGDWALGWTEGNERLQIVFVMMLFPLIMNAMQYYIIDGFIKQREEMDYSGHQRLAQEDGDEDRGPFDDALAESDDGESSDEDGRRAKTVKAQPAQSGPRRAAEGAEEYDPDLDGQTVVGSGRSQEQRGKVLPKELFPKE